MKIFENNNITFYCESKARRGGFKHICNVFIDNIYRFSCQCLYVNRTWEEFDFQSVLRKAEDYIDNNIKLEKFKRKF